MTDHSLSLPPTLRSRYQVRQTLCAGEGVETLLAVDRQTEAAVVMKLSEIVMVSPEEQLRVAAEAEATQASGTRSVAPILQWGVERDLFFVIVPHVNGDPLGARLRWGPLPVAEALALINSVLRAIESLHGRGFCHLNIRPSKVILGGGLGVDAVLLPAGIGRSRRVEQVRHGAPSDLLRFASPEQVGLISRPVGERSDLYAAGALLYACLAGRPPFDGTTVADLLARQVGGSLQSLRTTGHGAVPRSVDEFVRRLLRKDPDDRYHSAAAAIADVEALSNALSRGTAEPMVVLGRHDRRGSVTDPSLVGRTPELRRFESHLRAVPGGRGGVVLVEGESGAGKTRLLAELEDRAAEAGLVVLHGSRLEPDQRRPLEAFGGVVAGVLDHAARDDDYADWLRARLGDVDGSLRTALPELSGILDVVSTESSGPQEHGRNRSVRGLAQFLGAVGAPECPAVVLIDDCQWADDLTIDSLAEWQKRFARASSVVVVVAFRPDEINDTHPLRTMDALDRIVLAPLAAAQVIELAESAAGPLPTAALEVVEGWAQGNPFMVTAALRGLVEGGALIPSEQGWLLDEGKMDAARVGSDAATMLSGRLGRLSPATVALLSAGAVLGRRFDLPSASRVAGLDEATARGAISEAEEARIVFVPAETSEYAFVHDRLREAVLGRLSPDEQHRLHRAAADDLELHDPDRSFAIAYHFDAAGDSDRAIRYALPAAREARRRYALDLAEELYRIAHRAAVSSAQNQEVAGELGEVLKLSGRYAEAVSFIETARSLADAPELAAWAEAELGELAVKQGDTRRARDHLEAAIRLSGGRVPSRALELLALIVWEAGVHAVHLAGWEHLCRRYRPRPPSESASRLAQLYDRLLYPLWFDQHTLMLLWTELRKLNLAERGKEGLVLARAYATYGAGTAAVLPGLWRLALKRVDRSLSMRKSLNDSWGCGQSLNYRGTVLYAAGRLAEAMAALDEAEGLLQRTGDLWEVNLGRWHQALCLYRTGDLAGTVAVCETTLREALEIGDRQAVGAALEIWAKATDGELPPAIAPLATQAKAGDVQTRVSLLQAKALQLLQGGDPDRAVAVLEEAHQLVVGARLPNLYTVSVLSWLATARRRAVEAVPPFGRGRARRLLRKAKRTAISAVAAGMVFRHELPHALREAGLVAALEGKDRRARWLLDRSLAEAQGNGACYEAARTLQARAEVGRAAGWVGAGTDEAAAASALAELRRVGAPTTPDPLISGVALVQRYDALLQAGREITAAGSIEELSQSVCEAAVGLLRAERCSLLRTGDESGNDAVDAAVPMEAPREEERWFMERAVRFGRALVADERTGAAGQVTSTPGVRSALYAPITARGRSLACLRVTHHSISGAFGDEEQHLAAYLTALAGAAFERIILQREIMEQVIAAQEKERARVARDLHDEVGSGLTSLLLGLSPLEGSVPDSDAARRHTAELKALINRLLGQVRRLAFELRPTILDDLGLGAALSRLAQDVSSRHGLVVDLEAEALDELGRLGPNLESTVYRVVQEALTNVVRHSGAAECGVLVGRDGDRLRVIIEDDGSGFDLDGVRSGALGLRGMKERAALVGGAVRISSTPGAGTSVILEVPVG